MKHFAVNCAIVICSTLVLTSSTPITKQDLKSESETLEEHDHLALLEAESDSQDADRAKKALSKAYCCEIPSNKQLSDNLMTGQSPEDAIGNFFANVENAENPSRLNEPCDDNELVYPGVLPESGISNLSPIVVFSVPESEPHYHQTLPVQQKSLVPVVEVVPNAAPILTHSHPVYRTFGVPPITAQKPAQIIVNPSAVSPSSQHAPVHIQQYSPQLTHQAPAQPVPQYRVIAQSNPISQPVPIAQSAPFAQPSSPQYVPALSSLPSVVPAQVSLPSVQLYKQVPSTYLPAKMQGQQIIIPAKSRNQQVVLPTQPHNQIYIMNPHSTAPSASLPVISGLPSDSIPQGSVCTCNSDRHLRSNELPVAVPQTPTYVRVADPQLARLTTSTRCNRDLESNTDNKGQTSSESKPRTERRANPDQFHYSAYSQPTPNQYYGLNTPTNQNPMTYQEAFPNYPYNSNQYIKRNTEPATKIAPMADKSKVINKRGDHVENEQNVEKFQKQTELNQSEQFSNLAEIASKSTNLQKRATESLKSNNDDKMEERSATKTKD